MEADLKVARWGNSLAVRIPAAVVAALDLKEGDEVNLTRVADGVYEIGRDFEREQALQELRSLRRPLPPNYSFDRDEANEE